MNKKNKRGFTIAELIVVVMILAILWTIAFLSTKWYLKKTRDAVRWTDLRTIELALETQLTNWQRLFVPKDKVDILASWSLIWHQWYMSEDILNKILVNKWWKDPLDNSLYTYSIDRYKEKYQLMWFMEVAVEEDFFETVSAADLSERKPIVLWDELWIFLDPITNIPVQYYWMDVEILNTNDENLVYVNNDKVYGKVTWTWEVIERIMSHNINPYKNCINILKSWNSKWSRKYKIYPDWVNGYYTYCDMITLMSFIWKPDESCYSLMLLWYSKWDGIYTINPTWSEDTDVYCDMTTNWWWWTLLMKWTNWHTFHYESNYWTTNNTLNKTDLTLNNADAKYQAFNDLKIRDIMAQWPDAWWMEWYKEDAFENLTALVWFDTFHSWWVPQEQSDWNSTYFSSQTKQCTSWPWNYWTKLKDLGSTYWWARWWYGFNENGCWQYASDDAWWGIWLQTSRNSAREYSAWDWYSCCGAKRTFSASTASKSYRFEIYGR